MAVNLTGREGSVISTSDAKQIHGNYEKSKRGINSDEIKSMIFGKEQVMELLSPPACTGLRIYFGLKKVGNEYEPQLLLSAVNDNGGEIQRAGGILSNGVPCPKICPTNGL